MSVVSLQELVGQLILARLLVPERKPLSRAALKKPLDALRPRLTASEIDAQFEQSLSRLIDEGSISDSPLALTASGRTSTLAFWKIERIPARIRWEELKRDYLLPRLVGLPAAATKYRSRDVIAAILTRHHALPDDVDSDPESIIHALAWRQLGIESTARFTPEAVISRILLNSKKKASAGEVARQLAAKSLETPAKDLFSGALRRWIVAAEIESASRSEPIQSEDSPATLSQFAASTLAAAETNATGRFGTNKVFISHVWDSLRRDPDHSEIPLPQFKQRLLDAHRQGLLELSRADLVERMPADDLASSETNYFDAVFHFVCLK